MSSGVYIHKKGYHLSVEHRKKLSDAKKRNPPKNLYKKGVKRPDITGDKNPAKNPNVGKKISLSKFKNNSKLCQINTK